MRAVEKSGNATIFVSKDTDDMQYGKVVNHQVIGNSNENNYHSIIGLHIFPYIIVKKVKQVEISERGFLEIISVSKIFQEEEKLQIQELPSDCI